VKHDQDREVVAAIMAGDPGGIEEAYDRYAMPLYVYYTVTVVLNISL